MNNSVDLLKAHGLLAEVKTSDKRILAAFKILDKYSEITKGTGSSEIHRLLSHSDNDTLALHITPILDRMHAIEPETKVKYELIEEGDDLNIKLEIGPRRFEVVKHSTDLVKLLYRSMPFLEAFIQANKGSDGCVACGAGPQEICNASCSVLEAELVLRALERTF